MNGSASFVSASIEVATLNSGVFISTAGNTRKSCPASTPNASCVTAHTDNSAPLATGKEELSSHPFWANGMFEGLKPVGYVRRQSHRLLTHLTVERIVYLCLLVGVVRSYAAT